MTKDLRPEECALFQDMGSLPRTLWDDLAARPPLEAARHSGAVYEEGTGFTVPFLGGVYVVDPAGRRIAGPAGHLPPDFQKAMVLLGYLAKAQDFGSSGKMVSPRELPGGILFFGGSHPPCTEPIIDRFGHDPQGFLARAEALGATPDRQSSGFSFTWRVLPNITLACFLDPADDEFPAQVTYTFDSHSHHHLALDGLWAITNVLAAEMRAGGDA